MLLHIGKLYRTKRLLQPNVVKGEILMFLGLRRDQSYSDLEFFYEFLLSDGTVDRWYFGERFPVKDWLEPCK